MVLPGLRDQGQHLPRDGGPSLVPPVLRFQRQHLSCNGRACLAPLGLRGRGQRLHCDKGSCMAPLGLHGLWQRFLTKGRCVWSHLTFTAGGSAFPARGRRAWCHLAFGPAAVPSLREGGVHMASRGLLGWQQLLGACLVHGQDKSVRGQVPPDGGSYQNWAGHNDCLPTGDGAK